VGGHDRTNLASSARVREVRPQVELLHEPSASGREVGVDDVLQNRIPLLLAHQPGVLVLATGDGNGRARGPGFLPAIHLLAQHGWRIELLAWSGCVYRHLRAAGEHGAFVCLDDFFGAITFEPGGVRRSDLVHLENRVVAAPAEAAGAAVYPRLSSSSTLNPITGR
jgi:hypothetical protein